MKDPGIKLSGRGLKDALGAGMSTLRASSTIAAKCKYVSCISKTNNVWAYDTLFGPTSILSCLIMAMNTDGDHSPKSRLVKGTDSISILAHACLQSIRYV